MRWLLLLLLTGAVATCGQKGPLERPTGAFSSLATAATVATPVVRMTLSFRA